MIKVKDKVEFVCTFCGKKHPKFQGKCVCGAWNSLEEKVVTKKTYTIPKVSLSKKVKDLKEVLDKQCLDKFFDDRIEESKSNPYCQNCGKGILYMLNSKDTWIKRSTIAHILPKRMIGGFPSVKCHPDNFMLLCDGCHHLYDSNWAKAVTLSVYKIAITKYQNFKHLVKESKTKLPNDFHD